MGNHMSCMSPSSRQLAASDCSENLIKFLNCETTALFELEGPLTAADVMLEFPAQFLCCFSSMVSSGRRICAVPADEELQTTELYMLLPMQKLNKRISEEDMAFFVGVVSQSAIAGRQWSKGAGCDQRKVSPLPAAMKMSSSKQITISDGRRELHSLVSRGSLSMKVRLGDQGPASASINYEEPITMGSANQRSMCRSKSWMPKLDTIAEAIH